eukprot:bmy_01922T0
MSLTGGAGGGARGETDSHMVLSLEGADGGGSSAGNGPGVAPAAPAGGSRSSSRNLGSSGGEKEEGKKVRRQWESWSTEDKNTFFEGLYEKGKPASMVKNKEQVRHFYYRTWHKITKYIDFDNVFSRGLKKSSQELYGLICYGELRKKIGGCEYPLLRGGLLPAGPACCPLTVGVLVLGALLFSLRLFILKTF